MTALADFFLMYVKGNQTLHISECETSFKRILASKPAKPISNIFPIAPLTTITTLPALNCNFGHPPGSGLPPPDEKGDIFYEQTVKISARATCAWTDRNL